MGHGYDSSDLNLDSCSENFRISCLVVPIIYYQQIALNDLRYGMDQVQYDENERNS